MRTPPPLVILVLGGAAERWACPEEESPLACASTPNLDRLAAEGRVFGVQLSDDPASAAPLLSILGVDPARCETSRASYLGGLCGVELAPEECFVCADFVAVFRDMVADAEPEGLRPAEIDVLLRAAGNAMQRAGFRLRRGAGTRHLAVAPRASVDGRVLPTELTLGRKLEHLEPRVEQHAFAHRIGRQSLDAHEINEVRRDLGHNGADMLWLWGPGGHARLEGVHDQPVSAFGSDPYWRGICRAAGIPLKARNAKTPAGLVRALSQALRDDRICFVYARRGVRDALHRESGLRAEGIAALDEQLVGPVARAVARRGGRLLVLPDAARTTATGAPLDDPVPALLWGAGITGLSHHAFSEAGAAGAGEPVAPGYGLLAYVQRF